MTSITTERNNRPSEHKKYIIEIEQEVIIDFRSLSALSHFYEYLNMQLDTDNIIARNDNYII